MNTQIIIAIAYSLASLAAFGALIFASEYIYKQYSQH